MRDEKRDQQPAPFAQSRVETTPRTYIGCSGWNYRHWRHRFYPDEYRSDQWFAFYARTFDTVEINTTFYHLPSVETFDAWRAQAPAGFVYAVKANRYLTHLRKLQNVEEPLARFLERVRLLGKHLGPILYQLPPRWHLNRGRLESFLKLLPSDLLHVFEFRDQTWLVDDVFALLADRGASVCMHDFRGLAVPWRPVGPIVYVRLHGTERRYAGGYPVSALRRWWRRMSAQIGAGRDLYVYFNNDADAHAVRDASRLKRIAGFAPVSSVSSQSSRDR